MKIRKKILLGMFAIFSAASPLLHSITIQFAFSPDFLSGADLNGLAAATWDFEFTSSDTVYRDLNGSAVIVTDSAFLKITGATNTDIDGIYAISEADTTNFLFRPGRADLSGSFSGPLDANGLGARFTFGDIIVNPFIASDSSSDAIASPLIGDTVEASHFNGVILGGSTNSTEFRAGNFGPGFGDFFIPSTTISAVPEPASLALITGLAVFFTCYQRRR